MARARHHALGALAEGVATLRALVDAVSIATDGSHAAAGRGSALAETLDQLRTWLDPDAAREGGAVVDALVDALEAEIARWEQRSREDPEARPVLRAFLAVREVLWELGVRAPSSATEGSSPGPASVTRRPARSGRRGQRRVQRVPVEG